MSNAAVRLRNVHQTTKTAVISAASTPKPKPDFKPNPFSTKDIADEPNLDEVAKKIKHAASVSAKFRNRHNIYDFTISRLALANRHKLIEDILETHKQFNDIAHEGFALRLVSLYAKAGMFEHARKLFDELPELGCTRTVKSFNALLKAGVESKRFEEVFAIFREVPGLLSIECDVVSYNTFVHALCETGRLDEGLGVIEEMKEKGVAPSMVTFNTLLGAFYRERGFEGGERIWAMMDDYDVVRDIRCYNLKLQGLVHEGEIEKAVALFETLESQGVKPDVSTYNIFIKVCCDEENVEKAKQRYNELLLSGATPNSITFSTLVPTFCDNDDFELAFELCKKMFKRQFVVDEALMQRVVDGLVKDLMIEEAEELVELGKSNSYVQYSLVIPSDNTENQEDNDSP